MSITQWGWNSYFEAFWHGGEWKSAVPARVIAQQRKFWRVAGDFGEWWAEASGKLRLAADEGGDWPAVGDWVAAEIHGAETAAMIQEVLPRRSKFVRKMAGKKIEEQVMAANVDTALLVSALDGDFSPRRVERYLAQCWESGARPVIVLNKADACEESREKAAEMERVAVGTVVCVVSARTGEGFGGLQEILKLGQTLVLLGSSGVGKSTIANRLLGEAVQEVQPVRESDNKGRHTTTARELFVLPGGALLMDTPGLREMQLWDAEDGVAQTFADIDVLATQCRFVDCHHEGEPGCAVLAAVSSGELDAARMENRRKLLREQEFLRRKVDPEARLEQKEHWKQLHRAQRQKYQQRAKDGGKR
ncbi:MAG TPA: ribosome small subunit-dependent GTPase A [Candidatus Acidoferrum sp.]|nr:ribosome small subunit-dependent GTPase A [Candidatus Acidoferrum sp.]